MKDSILAIYNTLKQMEMPMTPDNAKRMAAIFIKLEEMYAKIEKEEKERENAEDHDE